MSDTVIDDLISMGYVAQAWNVDSVAYASAQHRLRVLVVAIFVDSPLHVANTVPDAQKILTNISKLMHRFKIEPVDYRQLMLPDTHPLVEAELARRLQSSSKERRSGWPAKHQACFKDVKLRWGSPVDMKCNKATEESRWFQTITQREKECIRYAGALLGYETSPEISQNIHRLRFDHEYPTAKDASCRVCCAVLPNMRLWRHSYDPSLESRPLIGYDMMTLQHFPWQSMMPNVKSWKAESRRQSPTSVPSCMLADIAGNAVCATVFVALQVSLFLSVPWKPACSSDSDMSADNKELLSTVLESLYSTAS